MFDSPGRCEPDDEVALDDGPSDGGSTAFDPWEDARQTLDQELL